MSNIHGFENSNEENGNMDGSANKVAQEITQFLDSHSLISYEHERQDDQHDFSIRLHVNGNWLLNADFELLLTDDSFLLFCFVPLPHKKGAMDALNALASKVNGGCSFYVIAPENSSMIALKVAGAFGIGGFQVPKFEKHLMFLVHYADKVLLPNIGLLLDGRISLEDAAERCEQAAAYGEMRDILARIFREADLREKLRHEIADAMRNLDDSGITIDGEGIRKNIFGGGGK